MYIWRYLMKGVNKYKNSPGRGDYRLGYYQVGYSTPVDRHIYIYIYSLRTTVTLEWFVAQIGTTFGTTFPKSGQLVPKSGHLARFLRSRDCFLRNLRFSIFSEPVPKALEGALLRAVALLNIGIMPHIRWQSCASCREEQLCHVQCGTIQAFWATMRA